MTQKQEKRFTLLQTNKKERTIVEVIRYIQDKKRFLIIDYIDDELWITIESNPIEKYESEFVG